MKISDEVSATPRPGLGVYRASMGTAAYEFIPVPFVDEYMINRQRRAMVREILKERGISHDGEVPDILIGGGKTLVSRLGSLSRGLVTKPLKKVFRSVFFWLSARSAARTAMVTYFLARFLHHPRLTGQGSGDMLTEERAKFLRQTFQEISKGLDIRAAKGAFRQLAKLLFRSRKASGKEVSETIESEAPGFIAEFDAMLDERLR